MAKTRRRTEKQELNREVERSMQEEQDIQAAIRDSGFFYDEESYHYAEYLAKQEEERRWQEMKKAEMYDDFDYFWGDEDAYDWGDEDDSWDGE